jgi:hypothetical protein
MSIINYRIKYHYNWEGVPMFQPQRDGSGHYGWQNIGPTAFVENGGYKTQEEAIQCIERLKTTSNLVGWIMYIPDSES